MFSAKLFPSRTVLAVLVATACGAPACADDGFPFGFEMTLDAARQPGSKRLPSLEIGDAGEVVRVV